MKDEPLYLPDIATKYIMGIDPAAMPHRLDHVDANLMAIYAEYIQKEDEIATNLPILEHIDVICPPSTSATLEDLKKQIQNLAALQKNILIRDQEPTRAEQIENMILKHFIEIATN